MSTLRFQIQLARINLMKRRIHAAWQARKSEQPCPDCGQVHPKFEALLTRILGGQPEPTDTTPTDPTKLN